MACGDHFSHDLKGMILEIRNEKEHQLKVELFAENANVLKMFVQKMYHFMPQDIEITIANAAEDNKKKDRSTILQQRNVLLREIVQFQCLFDVGGASDDFYGNNLSNFSQNDSDLPTSTGEREKEETAAKKLKTILIDRKRKFENRSENNSSRNIITLQKVLHDLLDKKWMAFESETDAAFAS